MLELRTAYYLDEKVRDAGSGSYIPIMARIGHPPIVTEWRYSRNRDVAQAGIDQLNRAMELSEEDVQAILKAAIPSKEIRTKRILRVFPRKTSYTPDDAMAFVGAPPLLRPDPGEVDEVHISTTFTWDRDIAMALADMWGNYYPNVQVGGPAFSTEVEEFVPGRYVIKGVTFTSRGCDRECAWCCVPEREGVLYEITDFPHGHIVQDNNLLQCSREHIANVIEMLKQQRKPAIFAGGLDARLVDEWFAGQLREIRIGQIFLAADNDAAVKHLRVALSHLAFLPRKKLRVYAMIGRESKRQAADRLEAIWKAGGMPFAQLYQPPEKWIEYDREWKNLVRVWSRPAIMYRLHHEAPLRIRTENSAQYALFQ